VGAVSIAAADTAERLCRVLSADANAVGFTESDSKPHIGAKHERAARDCSRFKRRIDQ